MKIPDCSKVARIREMATFFGRTFVRQTDPGFRKTIKHQGEFPGNDFRPL